MSSDFSQQESTVHYPGLGTLYYLFFGSIPIGWKFLHKGVLYTKTEEERAEARRDGASSLFEVHYGVLVSELPPKPHFRPL